MSIPLPPLPEHLHHPELQKLDAFTREQLRAHDQEIVRCVLEAAAKETRACAQGILADLLDVESHRRVLAVTHRINTLEFRHE